MPARVCIIFIILAIGLSSCLNNNTEKFIEKEKIEIYGEIENILKELGYNDFSIHINIHKNYNSREISKSISSTKIIGDEIPLNVISSLNYSNSEYAGSYESINNGYIEQRTMVVNYLDKENSGKIFYEYISIAVFIGNIEQNKINKLLKLFSNYILNNNRGDTIYIMPK